jgi:hypothetical protein
MENPSIVAELVAEENALVEAASRGDQEAFRRSILTTGEPVFAPGCTKSWPTRVSTRCGRGAAACFPRTSSQRAIQPWASANRGMTSHGLNRIRIHS